MLIMHVIVGLGVGGAELMLKRLVESHRLNSEYRHVVVSLTGLGEVGRQLRGVGVDVYSLGMKSFLGVPLVLWRLVMLVRLLSPDIVQTWMYHADLLGGLAARVAGTKNIIWGVRTTDVAAGGSRLTMLIRRVCAFLSYRVPRQIVCVAEASRKAHVAVGYDSERMVVIPNGFDVGRFMVTNEQSDALRAQCFFLKEHVVIGSVGRFNAVKDQNNFVLAAARLASSFPNVRFLMVGSGVMGANDELKQWIDQTGYADRFVLLGERDDVPVCLASMDIFCLHSRNEGFPNVLGEAMAMALPCVVTDVGDSAMLLAGNGIVVPRENSAALALGMKHLISMSSDERQKLGLRASMRVRSDYSMERVRDRFEDVYQNVMGRN